mgnify:CR=1 FL=1
MLCGQIAQSDKVGLLRFHGEVDHYIPPRKGNKHALRVVRDVLAVGRGPEPTREETLPARPDPIPQEWWDRALPDALDALRGAGVTATPRSDAGTWPVLLASSPPRSPLRRRRRSFFKSPALHDKARADPAVSGKVVHSRRRHEALIPVGKRPSDPLRGFRVEL